jgi:hypothetical protein
MLISSSLSMYKNDENIVVKPKTVKVKKNDDCELIQKKTFRIFNDATTFSVVKLKIEN